MKIEVSNGEIVDKLTIIEIKLEMISDAEKVKNLKSEFEVLDLAVSQIIDRKHKLYNDLLEINKKLWDIEDQLRDLERSKDFGSKFIELARAVYYTNDKRSEIKREINTHTGSSLFEEKSYSDYQ